jgi:hypothetical protein
MTSTSHLFTCCGENAPGWVLSGAACGLLAVHLVSAALAFLFGQRHLCLVSGDHWTSVSGEGRVAEGWEP